jgi:hypothetical protein
MPDLKEAKGPQDQGQAIEWRPMGQRNILVWEVLMRTVWQPTNDDVADESKRHFGFDQDSGD